MRLPGVSRSGLLVALTTLSCGAAWWSGTSGSWPEGLSRRALFESYRRSMHHCSTSSTGCDPPTAEQKHTWTESLLHESVAHLRVLQNVLRSSFVTLTMTASLVAAGISLDLPRRKVAVLCVTLILASGAATAVADFLTEQADYEFRLREQETEAREVRESPEEEQIEMSSLYQRRGISLEDAEMVTKILSKYPDYWVGHMMAEELQLLAPEPSSSARDSEGSEVDTSSTTRRTLLERCLVTALLHCLLGLLPLCALLAEPAEVGSSRKTVDCSKELRPNQNDNANNDIGVLKRTPAVAISSSSGTRNLALAKNTSTAARGRLAGKDAGGMTSPAGSIVRSGHRSHGDGAHAPAEASSQANINPLPAIKAPVGGESNPSPASPMPVCVLLLVCVPGFVLVGVSLAQVLGVDGQTDFVIAVASAGLGIALFCMVFGKLASVGTTALAKTTTTGLSSLYRIPTFVLATLLTVSAFLLYYWADEFLLERSDAQQGDHAADLAAATRSTSTGASAILNAGRTTSYFAVFVSSIACCLCTGLGCIPFFFFPESVSSGKIAVANLMAAGIMVAVSFELLQESHEIFSDATENMGITRRIAASVLASDLLPLITELDLFPLSWSSTLSSHEAASASATASSSVPPARDRIASSFGADALTAFGTDAVSYADVLVGFAIGIFFICNLEHVVSTDQSPAELLRSFVSSPVTSPPQAEPAAVIDTTNKTATSTALPGTNNNKTVGGTKITSSRGPTSRTDPILSSRVGPGIKTVPATATPVPSAEVDASARKLANKRRLFLFLAMFFHSFAEGVAIGVSFAGTEPALGYFIVLALALHNIPEGLVIGLTLCTATSSSTSSTRTSENVAEATSSTPGEAMFFAILSSFPQPVMAVFSLAAVHVARVLLPYGLAFAAGAMVYVSYEELWKEARAVLSLPASLACLCSSFAGMLLLQQTWLSPSLFR
ncbi:unnamed protein product [Amoebophrya sp. A120]|nr:unnamed protein product [Amoebophrya sp. A120]|eukprot:GSA120T00025211001.1